MYFKLKSCVNFCPQSLAPDFKAYTCVINNPYLSIGIHSVMQIRIALIPLITYTPPNDLATHNNVYNDRIFDKNIFIFMAKYITIVLILISIADKLSYDLSLSYDHLNSIYVCRRFAK